jgi:multiple sugar transport system ATP-binding protein
VQMRTEISRLQKRFGTTTVYVTHDQTEAMTLGDRVAVLRKGILQQVASPRELYNNPINLFVAGFIGSPSMNFLPAKLKSGRLELPVAEIPLPEEFVSRLGHDEKPVIVGVRPEDFEDSNLVDDRDRDRGSEFSARIDVIEWMGSELFAYLPVSKGDQAHQAGLAELARELDQEDLHSDSDESQVVARLNPSSRVREGEMAKLWVDTTRLHLFDPETGDNLTYVEPDQRAQPKEPSAN